MKKSERLMLDIEYKRKLETIEKCWEKSKQEKYGQNFIDEIDEVMAEYYSKKEKLLIKK